MTDGVTDDIVWIQGTKMPWFNTRLGPEKRKKPTSYICIIYLYDIYCIYLIIINISHIMHIYVESILSGI